MSESGQSPVTVPSLRSRKRRTGAVPIVMVTAYDEPGARIVSNAGVDWSWSATRFPTPSWVITMRCTSTPT